jgi:hypothetical protein
MCGEGEKVGRTFLAFAFSTGSRICSGIDMKRTQRSAVGWIVCVVLVGLIAWYVWPHKPAPTDLSKAKETRLPGNTNRLPVHVTDTGVPIADPALEFGARPQREIIVGIGAALKWDQESGAPQIANVLPNSPALQAGLSAGLIIHKIDAIATKGMRLEDCVSLIRGPAGTKVRLEVIDPEQNETNTVELTRQRLQL